MSDSSAPQPFFGGANSAGEPAPFFYETLLDNLYDGVYFVDQERRITYWNKGAERLTGYPASEVVGRQCFDSLLVHVNEDWCPLCRLGCPLANMVVDGVADGERREREVYLRHKVGHRVPISIRVAPIVDSAGRFLGAVEMFSDLTAKKKTEKRVRLLENLAFLDPLTGIPNRRYMELKVKQAIQEVEQFGRNVGLLEIDIDHFKLVNDKYGHEIGDDALKAVSKTLAHSLRPGDIVGRWGGEEFLVIVADVDLVALSKTAERCRMLVAESFVPVREKHIRLTVSLGATLMKHGDSGDLATKRVDELMYRSKKSGRNRVTLG